MPRLEAETHGIGLAWCDGIEGIAIVIVSWPEIRIGLSGPSRHPLPNFATISSTSSQRTPTRWFAQRLKQESIHSVVTDIERQHDTQTFTPGIIHSA